MLYQKTQFYDDEKKLSSISQKKKLNILMIAMRRQKKLTTIKIEKKEIKNIGKFLILFQLYFTAIIKKSWAELRERHTKKRLKFMVR